VRRAALAIAALALIALTGGCGSSESGYASIGESSATRFGPARDSVRVEMRNIAFAPANVHLRRGGTVEWVNRDRVTHTVTKGNELYDEWSSGDIESRGTFTHTFDRPGEFVYNCTIHANMKGRVKVD
jgi:plastocyanin